MGQRTRGKRDEGTVSRFVERFALSLSEVGFPRMPARVFVGVLTASEGRLTAAQMAKRLHVSPAAISGAVRYLMQIGLLVREREPGERSDHYRLRSDVWYEAITRRDDHYTRWEQELREGIEAVGVDTPAGARLDETRRFFEFVRGETPRLMARWRELRQASPAPASRPKS